MPDVAKKTSRLLPADENEYGTIRVNSKILTDLKAYLLTDVLPRLTDLPDYDDSQDYKETVLSIWIGEAIRQGLEKEGFYSGRKTERKPSRDDIGRPPFGEVATKC